jgi:hypothetical protein
VDSIWLRLLASLYASASLTFSGRSNRQKSPFPRLGCSSN